LVNIFLFSKIYQFDYSLKTILNILGFHYNKHIIFYGVLCFFITNVQGQFRPRQLRNEVLQSISPTKPTPKSTKKQKRAPLPIFKPLAPIVNPMENKNATLVYLENSESLSFDKIQNPDIQVLKGNVRFRHDNALLYCDSAYFYEKANSLDAFGHVKIVQGDTLFVYGDFLYYDGNIKLAKLRRNVRMENRKTKLTTDSLNYDRMGNLAYYYTGGKIKDELNILTSIWGQYSPKTNEALFKKAVHLDNKDFTLDADSLRYNTKTNIANLISSTHILYNKETDIYSDKGWYNTSTEKMMLLNRSLVKHNDGKTLIGDTIFYDKKKKFGEGFSNVVMLDSVQKATLYGNYIYYNENGKNGMGTDSAQLVDWSSKDTMYVHADTLLTSKDSIYDVARGYYHVRIYRDDVQGLCDSLAYSARDSIINLYGEPVLWAENSQLSGDSIRAYTKNKAINKIFIKDAAMAVQHEDSLYYNQLSGKEIIALVDSGQVRKINVNGNAETIYYPRDEKDSTLIGLNKTQSSYVVMFMKKKKVDKIVMTSASNGIMYPLKQLSGGDLYLKNYFWLEEQRPKKRQDIFLTFAKKPREKIGTSTLMNKSTETSPDTNSSPNQKSPTGTNPSTNANPAFNQPRIPTTGTLKTSNVN
jgi:lipopolysaccharide export system protein LptA